MTFIEAFNTGKPMRRKCWDNLHADYRFIILNPKIYPGCIQDPMKDCMDWCKEDGIPSENCYGRIDKIELAATDWEVYEN